MDDIEKYLPNTQISFLYRDGANYKTSNAVVIRGGITEDQKRRILESLDVDGGFVPEKVGLEAKRWYEYDSQYDHKFCELYESDFEPTDSRPDVDIDAETLASRFEAVSKSTFGWDCMSRDFPWELALPDEILEEAGLL